MYSDFVCTQSACNDIVCLILFKTFHFICIYTEFFNPRRKAIFNNLQQGIPVICVFVWSKSESSSLFCLEISKCLYFKPFHTLWKLWWHHVLDNIYLFKVNNRNTTKKFKTCVELTIKTPERRHWRRSSVLLVTLKMFHTFFYCFYCWHGTSKC